MPYPTSRRQSPGGWLAQSLIGEMHPITVHPRRAEGLTNAAYFRSRTGQRVGTMVELPFILWWHVGACSLRLGLRRNNDPLQQWFGIQPHQSGCTFVKASTAGETDGQIRQTYR